MIHSQEVIDISHGNIFRAHIGAVFHSEIVYFCNLFLVENIHNGKEVYIQQFTVASGPMSFIFPGIIWIRRQWISITVAKNLRMNTNPEFLMVTMR